MKMLTVYLIAILGFIYFTIRFFLLNGNENKVAMNLLYLTGICFILVTLPFLKWIYDIFSKIQIQPTSNNYKAKIGRSPSVRKNKFVYNSE